MAFSYILILLTAERLKRINETLIGDLSVPDEIAALDYIDNYLE